MHGNGFCESQEVHYEEGLSEEWAELVEVGDEDSQLALWILYACPIYQAERNAKEEEQL